MIYDNIDSQLTFEVESAITQLNEQIELNRYQFHQISSNQVLTEEQMYYKTIVLNEGIKESITEFIQKVTAAVSKVWNIFKNFQNTQTIELMNKNKDKLTSDFKMICPDNFEIPKVNNDNWETYNEKIQIKDFASNYETWKQQKVFETVDQFIKMEYSDLLKPDMNLVQSMHKDMFMEINETKGKVITSEVITPFVNFVNNFVKTRDSISKDIDSLNASNKNIEAMLAKIVSVADHYIGFEIFDLLTEGNTKRAAASVEANKASLQTQNAQQSQEKYNEKNKNKFRSADPQDQQNDENKKKLAEDRKNIVTYYKASTQIFSAKLKTCRAIERACEKIVTNFIKLQLKGNKTKTEQPAANQTTTTNQQSTTIQK